SDEPIEAVEIVNQSSLGVFVGVIEDADQARVATVADDFEKLKIELALAEGENLLAGFVSILRHAIQIQRQEIGFHLSQKLGESGDVFVAVMLVVYHSNIGNAFLF